MIKRLYFFGLCVFGSVAIAQPGSNATQLSQQWHGLWTNESVKSTQPKVLLITPERFGECQWVSNLSTPRRKEGCWASYGLSKTGSDLFGPASKTKLNVNSQKIAASISATERFRTVDVERTEKSGAFISTDCGTSYIFDKKRVVLVFACQIDSNFETSLTEYLPSQAPEASGVKSEALPISASAPTQTKEPKIVDKQNSAADILQALATRHKAVGWLDNDDVYKNPFRFEGKTVIVRSRLIQFINKNTAQFGIDRPFLVTGLDAKTYTGNTTSSVLMAVRIKGVTELAITSYAKFQVPEVVLLEQIDCKDECREFNGLSFKGK